MLVFFFIGIYRSTYWMNLNLAKYLTLLNYFFRILKNHAIQILLLTKFQLLAKCYSGATLSIEHVNIL